MPLAAVLAAAVAAPARSPPLWGGALQWSATSINFTSPDVALNASWWLDYSYDATRNASLWRNRAGQRDTVCRRANASLTAAGAPCDVLHAADGMEYISFPDEGLCCRCPGDRGGFLDPHWLSSAKHVGAERVNGVLADHWLLLANYDNHYWSTADAEARPVRFLEHEWDKGFRRKSWDFGGYRRGPPPAARFEPPPRCEAVCGGYCAELGRGRPAT